MIMTLFLLSSFQVVEDEQDEAGFKLLIVEPLDPNAVEEPEENLFIVEAQTVDDTPVDKREESDEKKGIFQGILEFITG